MTEEIVVPDVDKIVQEMIDDDQLYLGFPDWNLDEVENDPLTTWEGAVWFILGQLTASDHYPYEQFRADVASTNDPEGIIDAMAALTYDTGMWNVLMSLTHCYVTWEHSENPQMSDDDIVHMLAGKQRDYGPDNILRFGIEGIQVRLWDKIARLRNLMNNRDGHAANEAIFDTIFDMLGYTILAHMLSLGWFELPLKEDLDAANETPEQMAAKFKVTLESPTLTVEGDDDPDS